MFPSGLPDMPSRDKLGLAPRKAYRSFENLVVLANAEEAWNSTKKLVWRDDNDAPVLLETLRDCLKHAATGGLRAYALAFGIRSGISVFLLIINIIRFPRRFRFALIRRAVFGPEPLRFAAMIGFFVAGYKLILNSLPILTLRLHRLRQPEVDRAILPSNAATTSSTHSSPTKPQRTRRFSITPFDDDSDTSNTPHNATRPPSRLKSPAALPSPGSSQPHLSSLAQTSLALAQEKGLDYRFWHASLAGTISGAVAIMFERPNQRSAVAQQMFVRGLQGAYNTWSQHTGIKVLYGSVLVFSLCCGQIIYAYLLKPHTLSPIYDSWIQSMSIAPLEGVKINRSLVLDGRYDTKLLEKLLDGKSKPWNGRGSFITPRNREQLVRHLDEARKGNFGPRLAPCATLDPHHDGCIRGHLIRIAQVAKLLLPAYGALHFIPMVLFKRKAMLKYPLKMILKASFGTLRSSTFIGIFVFIIRINVCFMRNLHYASMFPTLSNVIAPALAKSKLYWWIAGSLCGLSLLVEDPRRREELAMYCLPKAGESAWLLFRGEVLGIEKRRKGAWRGDSALSAVAMGMVMTIYQTNPAALSSFVRRVLYQFIGPN